MCDYSAIEMRLAAEISGDRAMLEAFRDGADVHRRTAAAIAGKPESEITKAERQRAKAAGFGLLYGDGQRDAASLPETGYGVKMTPEEAAVTREKFLEAYPGLAAWHRRQGRPG